MYYIIFYVLYNILCINKIFFMYFISIISINTYGYILYK